MRVEAYGDYLKKRGKSLLASERARVAPFVSTFGDGIDCARRFATCPTTAASMFAKNR